MRREFCLLRSVQTGCLGTVRYPGEFRPQVHSSKTRQPAARRAHPRAAPTAIPGRVRRALRHARLGVLARPRRRAGDRRAANPRRRRDRPAVSASAAARRMPHPKYRRRLPAPRDVPKETGSRHLLQAQKLPGMPQCPRGCRTSPNARPPECCPRERRRKAGRRDRTSPNLCSPERGRPRRRPRPPEWTLAQDPIRGPAFFRAASQSS